MARTSHAMGPSVRLLLSKYLIDPKKVNSTGPHRTILKSDVLTYVSQIQGRRKIYTPETNSGFTEVVKIKLG